MNEKPLEEFDTHNAMRFPQVREGRMCLSLSEVEFIEPSSSVFSCPPDIRPNIFYVEPIVQGDVGNKVLNISDLIMRLHG